METQISRVTEFDAALIKDLFEKAAVADPAPNPAFFEDDRNIMLVARTDGTVSGFLWAYVLTSPDRPGNKMHFYSIDTFDPFKRRGIGTQMIERLKDIARDYGCYKMFVNTHNDNLPAMALYKGTGGITNNYGKDVGFEYYFEDADR